MAAAYIGRASSRYMSRTPVRAEPVRRALIIGVDGCRTDTIRHEHCPTLCDMAGQSNNPSWKAGETHSAHGPDVWSKTSRITLSAPAWTSALTGRWPKTHRVLNNQSWHNYDSHGAPTMFSRLTKIPAPAVTSSSIISWGALEKPLMSACRSVRVFEGNDAGVEEEFTRQAESNFTDSLFFLHLGDVDMAGHAHGYSPSSGKYVEALRRTDDRLRSIRSAVLNRASKHPEEQWVAIVCTDHGGGGKYPMGHGDNTPIVRRNFVWVNYIGRSGEVLRKTAGQNIIDVPRYIYPWFGVDSLKLLGDTGEDPDDPLYRKVFQEYSAGQKENKRATALDEPSSGAAATATATATATASATSS